MILGLISVLWVTSPVTRTSDGIRIQLAQASLFIQVRDSRTIRIAASPDNAFFGRSSYVEIPVSGPQAPFTVATDPHSVQLRTSELRVRVELPNGVVSFFDKAGKQIASESGRSIEPAVVDGEKTFHVRQTWSACDGESLYGLGQRSMGPFDIKGIDLDLWQRNSFVVVPFLTSSKGYGIYWDNASYTRFGDLRQAAAIPATELIDQSGKPGALTGSFYSGRNFDHLVATRLDDKFDFPNSVSGSDGKGFPGLEGQPTQPVASATANTAQPSRRRNGNAMIHPNLPGGDVSIRWSGFIDPVETGNYLFDAYSNGGIRLYVDGRLLIDHWRQSWLPEKDVLKAYLTKGKRVAIRLEWVKDQGANTFVLRWKTPSHITDTSLWSEVGDGVDYTFVYGPKLADVIAGYRKVTGRATMPPKWAFGLWQSRQRYETQAQSLSVVDGFRRRGIPFDNIVQDWFYWRADQWGSHEFDPTRFPDPVGWIKDLHARHANLMISVWGKFYPGTKNFDALRSNGFLYEPNLLEGRKDWVNQRFTFFDPFRSEAREMFWSQIDRELFKKGVDAWWMDASEPDLMSVPNLEGHRARMTPTGLGTPSKGINLYALATAQAVYEGQRKSAPDKRVFNLTRSGYAGQQRYGATTWSGDITSTWTAMERQITAALDFSISGNPYWTMDCGGFSVPSRFGSRNPSPADLDEWRELNTRWFQFATFVPLLRVHGEFPYREMWEFGGEQSPAFKSMLTFDQLRYQLQPYIYSLAGAVTQSGGTILRPLVMDYPRDSRLRDIRDEYMFGPALLVSPVVHYRQRVRPVVLPKGLWYDLWSGVAYEGGQTVESSAPFDRIPVHVRAGSIIPTGPELQYTGEKQADPVTLTVYTGADGKFNLYEDDGVTNGYERGAFSTIPITWSEATHTLTIGNRMGTYPGMLAKRTFQVRFVNPSHAVPWALVSSDCTALRYKGSQIKLVSQRANQRVPIKK